MTTALRYIIVGLVCASISALFQPAWYVTVIAFYAGIALGFVGSLAVGVFDYFAKDKP
jgi:uncharacterized membrane protein YjjP (DUF1212 family)